MRSERSGSAPAPTHSPSAQGNRDSGGSAHAPADFGLSLASEHSVSPSVRRPVGSASAPCPGSSSIFSAAHSSSSTAAAQPATTQSPRAQASRDLGGAAHAPADVGLSSASGRSVSLSARRPVGSASAPCPGSSPIFPAARSSSSTAAAQPATTQPQPGRRCTPAAANARPVSPGIRRGRGGSVSSSTAGRLRLGGSASAPSTSRSSVAAQACGSAAAPAPCPASTQASSQSQLALSVGPPDGALPACLERLVATSGFLQGPDCLDEQSLLQRAAGLSTWEDFVAEVITRRCPLRQSLRPLPRLHALGLRKRASLSDAAVAVHRAEQLQTLRRLAVIDGPSVGPRWGLLQKVCSAIGYEDTTLAHDADQNGGFKLLGHIPPSGLWPARNSEPNVSEAELRQRAASLLRSHADERKRGFFRLPQNHRAELITQLRERAAKGYFKELSLEEAEVELGEWAGWLYFLVIQADKRRGCLSPESANELQMLPEVAYMCGVDGYVELCIRFAEALGHRGQTSPKLRGFREDYEDGFYQYPISRDDQKYLCAYGWDDRLGVRVFVPQRLLLGPRPGPYIFVRGSVAMSTIAAALLAIPQLPHVDDLCGVETVGGMPSARQSIVELFEIFQFRLGASKAVPPRSQPAGSESLRALGVLVNFAVSDAERRRGVLLTVDLPPEKAAAYIEQVAAVLAQGQLPAGLASKLAGRWDHASAVVLGRSGRAFTWPLRARAKDSHDITLSCLLVASLRGFQTYLQARAPMPVFADTVARHAVLAFVDASRRDMATGEQAYRLGGVIWGPGLAECFSLDVPVTATALLPQEAGNAINEAEALAGLVAIRHLSGRVQDLDILLFIDSQAAEGVLIKGYSRSPELTAIAALFWSSVRQNGAACWVGRVPSSLNVADGFSRNDFLLQQRLCLTWARVSIPQAVGMPWLHKSVRQQPAPAAAAAARKDRRRQKHLGLG